MDKVKEVKVKEDSPNWLLMVSMSPIAVLVLILLALVSLLQFLFKASLLFIIVAIHTPFAMMDKVSILVFDYYIPHVQEWIVGWSKKDHPTWKVDNSKPNNDTSKSSDCRWNSFDPRASVGIEIQSIVSDFFKTITAELLVVISGGIITFYTAPLKVFYISMAIAVGAIIHKWLNTDCLSKTALSCLFDGYGLNPLMFLFSFIGFFNIGCHPVAKCSFVAKKAFVFVEDDSQFDEEDGPKPDHGLNTTSSLQSDRGQRNDISPTKVSHHRFDKLVKFVTTSSESPSIDFKWKADGRGFNKLDPIDFEWNAFSRGLFKLNPRIDFIKTCKEKYILKSFMVLKIGKHNLQYPVERLELPEDYSKVKELYYFLNTLSSKEAFVTDKLRDRYEHSLTLLGIAEGVQKYVGYKIEEPKEVWFVVAKCTSEQ